MQTGSCRAPLYWYLENKISKTETPPLQEPFVRATRPGVTARRLGTLTQKKQRLRLLWVEIVVLWYYGIGYWVLWWLFMFSNTGLQDSTIYFLLWSFYALCSGGRKGRNMPRVWRRRGEQLKIFRKNCLQCSENPKYDTKHDTDENVAKPQPTNHRARICFTNKDIMQNIKPTNHRARIWLANKK